MKNERQPQAQPGSQSQNPSSPKQQSQNYNPQKQQGQASSGKPSGQQSQSPDPKSRQPAGSSTSQVNSSQGGRDDYPGKPSTVYADKTQNQSVESVGGKSGGRSSDGKRVRPVQHRAGRGIAL